MSSDQSVFNHVGLCVTDLERAQRFYEEAFGFQVWWELEPPDGVSTLLQLEPPLDLKAVYLVRDGFVLELLSYRVDHRTEPWRKRSMAEPGLTHISLAVHDVEAAMRTVEEYGGQAIRETYQGAGVMVRDPDGQLIELLPVGWREKYLPPPRPTA